MTTITAEARAKADEIMAVFVAEKDRDKARDGTVYYRTKPLQDHRDAIALALSETREAADAAATERAAKASRIVDAVRKAVEDHRYSDEAVGIALRQAWATCQSAVATSISAMDPLIILAGIRQFGLAPDGSDLRDLETAIRSAKAPAEGE